MNVLEIIIKLLVKNTLNLYFNSLKMIAINYQKRKNIELFKRFEEPTSLFLSKTQNYIPIYSRFFNLNDNNYNSINLNNKWYISNINEQIEDNDNVMISELAATLRWLCVEKCENEYFPGPMKGLNWREINIRWKEENQDKIKKYESK